jgi:prolyl-tRNA editing enzyme YbaK/EbsC (Cys-tRNA(Pro) deacylase)
MDPRVLKHEVVYAEGGEEDALMRLAPEAILRQTEAQLIDLLSPPEAGL